MINAIRMGRIHQAYLMTGPRGIGKTSIARIFSKAIRCESIRYEGDWLFTCDECASCREITAGNGVDVIEIDGASNNGVEAIREIRENAKYLPSTGTRKIYIIDEVHMLSSAAFNALLKTLEEPPPHVIFIFATTEPHKIPATILSRVQRFDLKRLTVGQIQGHLTEVAAKEGVSAEPAALSLIARAAEGAMRDAMSILDQVIAYSGKSVTVQAARESIGLIETQNLIAIARGVLERKPEAALAPVAHAFEQGHDLKVLTRGLIEVFYALIVAKAGLSKPVSLEVTDEEWSELVTASQLRELGELELIFQALHHATDWIARSPQPKLVLDVVLIKCATAEALVSLSDGVPSAGTSSITAPSANSATAPITASIQKTTAPQSVAPSVQTFSAPRSQSAPSPQAVQAPVAAAPKSWEGFIVFVRAKRPLLASLMEHASGEVTAAEEGAQLLSILFRTEDSHYRDQLSSRANAEQIQSFVKEYFGSGTRLKVDLGNQVESPAAKRERERNEKLQRARKEAQNHPMIAEARSLFGGELGPIEITEANGDA